MGGFRQLQIHLQEGPSGMGARIGRREESEPLQPPLRRPTTEELTWSHLVKS